MPLHERVVEIFATESDVARAAFSNSLRRFLVPDIGANRTGIAFVLLVESPHTHEVGYRYPLAGDTGRYVTKKLYGCARSQRDPSEFVPIGRYVHDGHVGQLPDNVNHLEFPPFGIMNVSHLPLMREAYDCVPWSYSDYRGSDSWNSYTRCIKAVKDRPGATNRRIPNCRELDEAIAEDLKARLKILHRENPCVLLVCCGTVARNFYGKTGVKMWDCDLPHPSIGPRWNDLCCEQKRRLKSIRKSIRARDRTRCAPELAELGNAQQDVRDAIV